MSDKGQQNKNPNQGGGPGRQILVWAAIMLGIVIVISMVGKLGSLSVNSQKISYDEFLKQASGEISGKRIKSIKIDKKTGEIRGEYITSGISTDKATGFTTEGPSTETLTPEFNQMLASKGIKLEYIQPSVFLEMFLAYGLPILLILFIFYFFIGRQMRGGGAGNPFSFGKSRAVRIEKGKNQKTFKDVAGIDEAREEVMEIVDFLREPAKAERLGGRLPRGVLLIGPPGTGKTLLAKAIAGEADVPFFSISGSDFVEMFVGVGASRVRDLFEQAKSHSPCIIFLDEIDAVGRKRANEHMGAGQEAAQTLNAILVEMDGFTSDDKVIVIAATNRVDVLDPALLRPGRFDRRITVDLPDIKGREEILKVHVKNVKLGEDVDLSVVARATPTFSGAELENVVNEAALIAAFADKDSVGMASFEEARDKVRFGKEKKSRVMRDEDRRDTAFHEAGHALLMTLLPHVTPLHKVSIIPRGRALGVTMQLPERDEYSTTKRKILGEVTVFLGGRAAEELFLEDVSSGASNDIERATGYVKAMICEWGMSEELGLVNYSDRQNKGNNFFEGREFSEATAETIDRTVKDITNKCYAEAKELLQKHEDDVRIMVDALMEFEVLSKDEITDLLEKRDLECIRATRAGGKNTVTMEQSPDEKISVEAEDNSEPIAKDAENFLPDPDQE